MTGARILNALALLFAAVLISTAAYFGYLALYPFKTLEFYNAPFPIVSDQVNSQTKLKQIRVGEALTYEVDYCRFTEAPTEYTRTLTGPAIITLNIGNSATTEIGCRKLPVSGLFVPLQAPPGIYHVDINLCWQVNAFQSPCQQLKTQPFEVIK